MRTQIDLPDTFHCCEQEPDITPAELLRRIASLQEAFSKLYWIDYTYFSLKDVCDDGGIIKGELYFNFDKYSIKLIGCDICIDDLDVIINTEQ